MAVTDYTTLQGRTIYGSDQNKIGKIADLYDDPTGGGMPLFATVHTGLFGSGTSFVPLRDADTRGDDITVPYTKDFVKDAPRIDADAEISTAEEQEIYAYYGLDDPSRTQAGYAAGTDAGYTGAQADADYAGAPADSGIAGSADTGYPQSTGNVDRTGTADTTDSVDSTVGHDTSGPNTDDAMTRSEERLHVGTEQVETGRARLRKYIVTENVQQTVPVTHEEVRIEREPITEANAGAAYDGADLSEEEHEVTLHAERPVVSKETVPVERVRLGTDQVTEQAQVDEQVRKEQIDTGDADVNRNR